MKYISSQSDSPRIIMVSGGGGGGVDGAIYIEILPRVLCLHSFYVRWELKKTPDICISLY